MNVPIARLFLVTVLLFGLLVGATSWWTVVRADELNTKSQNPRASLRSLKVRRGAIRDADGNTIAGSRRGSDGIYVRTYPQQARFGHPVGYALARLELGQSGLEAFRDNELSGRRTGLRSAAEQLIGQVPQGRNVVTSLVPDAQQAAIDAIKRTGASGSVVALDPGTGAVEVLASDPGYDPGSITSRSAFSRLSSDQIRRPLINRAVQFGEAPGSTFKVLTSVAAIDSGKFKASSLVDGQTGRIVSGRPLANDFNRSYAGLDLTTALAKSVNTAFAGVAESVGKSTMQTYMKRFGFFAKPELDYPATAMSSSAIVPSPPGRPVPATSRFVDIGRVGIGQGGLQASTLQMAQVAAAVANKGKLMKPHLTSRITDRAGRTVQTIKPETQQQVMKPSTAATVTKMMEAVVNRGTGSAAKIPGVQVAGKTGTAETQIGAKVNDVWFIAFAPSRSPRVAIAVNVQDVTGFGGEIAAPIARDVMRILLARTP